MSAAIQIKNRYANVDGRDYRLCYMNGTLRFIVQRLHAGHEGRGLCLNGRVAKAVIAALEPEA